MAAELLDDSDRLAREALLDMSADRIRSPSWQQAPTATHPRAVNVTASCRCGRVPPEHYDHDQDAQNAPRTGRNTRGSLPGATLATRRSGVGVPLAPLCDEALYPARYRMSDPARQGRIAVCCRPSQRECAADVALSPGATSSLGRSTPAGPAGCAQPQLASPQPAARGVSCSA